MKKEDIEFLDQLGSALEKAIPQLKEAYTSRQPESFVKVKKFILDVQKKINETIE